jgi:EXS family
MSGTQEVGEIFGAGAGPAHAMLRSPTVLIAAIGLWGMNIYFFRVFGIDYVKVLNHDLLKMEEQDELGNNSQHNHTLHRRTHRNSTGGTRGLPRKDSELAEGDSYNSSETKGFVENNASDDEEIAIMESSPLEDSVSAEITAGRLVCLSVTLLVLLHSTYSVWIDWLGGGSIGAIFAFYGAVTTAVLFPLQSTRWLRTAAVLVLHRAFELINPRCHHCWLTSNNNTGADDIIKSPRPIPFVDVFFADAMCSMSKVFFDWGMLLNMAAYYPNPVPMSAWNILIPSAAAAVPFIIRARQCLVMWSFASIKNDPGRYQHLWNALKYSTSIFPLCLSAYQKTVMKERAADLEVYLILLLVINAAYALWWDVGTWRIE